MYYNDIDFGKRWNIFEKFLQFPKYEEIDKMILSYKETYKNDFGIEKAINNNEIYKVSRGIYSDKKNIDLMVIYSKKILTSLSLIYYFFENFC